MDSLAVAHRSSWPKSIDEKPDSALIDWKPNFLPDSASGPSPGECYDEELLAKVAESVARAAMQEILCCPEAHAHVVVLLAVER